MFQHKNWQVQFLLKNAISLHSFGAVFSRFAPLPHLQHRFQWNRPVAKVDLFLAFQRKKALRKIK